MKLATFTRNNSTRIGVVTDEGIVDLSVAAPGLPPGMSDFLAAGEAALDAARNAAASAAPRIPTGEVRWEPVVPHPGKFLAIGMNYMDHVKEFTREAPKFPTIFNKQITCVNGHLRDIVIPAAAPSEVDYEGELGIVIGRRCRAVARKDAREVIAGFTIVNDVSVRDWQRRAPTMTLGKSWDTHGPVGPWIVTTDEVPDPHALEITTTVNGERRQHSSTGNMMTDCYALVELLSTVCTLEPGDILATGTPSGVGMAMNPPGWLKPGDRVRIEITGIGALENPVVAETTL